MALSCQLVACEVIYKGHGLVSFTAKAIKVSHSHSHFCLLQPCILASMILDFYWVDCDTVKHFCFAVVSFALFYVKTNPLSQQFARMILVIGSKQVRFCWKPWSPVYICTFYITLRWLQKNQNTSPSYN